MTSVALHVLVVEMNDTATTPSADVERLEAAPKPQPKPRSRLRVWLRRLAWVVLVVLLLLSLLLLAITIMMNTERGREALRGAMVDGISDSIDGSMGIEELAEMSWGHVRLRGMTVVDPRGVSVLTAEDTTVHLVWPSILRGVIHFDRVTAHGLTLLVARGEKRSTSLGDAFSPTGRTDAQREAGEGQVVLIDQILVEDAAVRLRMGAPIALHVTSAEASVDHDPMRRPSGERATRVDLKDVYANLYMDGREGVSGTDIRAAGSVYDLKARVCHSRGLIAVHIIVSDDGGTQLVYSTNTPLISLAMRIASRRANISMRSGGVDLEGVPRCGPPPRE